MLLARSALFFRGAIWGIGRAFLIGSGEWGSAGIGNSRGVFGKGSFELCISLKIDGMAEKWLVASHLPRFIMGGMGRFPPG